MSEENNKEKKWFVELQKRAETFANMYLSANRKDSFEDALNYVNTEMYNLFFRVNEVNLGTSSKPVYIESLSIMSILNGFGIVVSAGLSFSDLTNDVYLQTLGNRIDVKISPYGEAAYRIARGIFLGYDDPVCYYSTDNFTFTTNESGEGVVFFESHERTEESVFKGVFMKVVRHDNSFFYSHFTAEEIKRFQDSGNYNSKVYSHTDAIAKAKCIKHTFKRQPSR